MEVYKSKQELEKNFLLAGATLKFFTNWLNENHKKDSGKPFTHNDAFSYANKTKKLPDKYGGNTIIKSKGTDYGGAGIYILKDSSEEAYNNAINFYFNNHLL